jgi:cellulose synthase (UDP-forming)
MRDSPVDRLQRAGLRVAGVVGGAGLLLVALTPLDLRSQALFACMGFALAVAIGRWRSPYATVTLALLSVTASTRYLAWRVAATLSGGISVDTALGALLLAAEAYAFAMLLLGYLQSIATIQRRPEPLPADPDAWPTVDVLIPTYDEPLDVVRATIVAARAMDWPGARLKIWVLDDGRRPEFRGFAARMGVGYLTRPDNAHAKAGNINAALARTRGDYVAIFDSDHVPVRSFLQLTVGWFLRDAKLAMVQTPHHFYSPDPFERNLRTFRRVPNEGELFYGLIQPANDLWNAAFFCGSCAVIRRAALDEVGGIAVETVTEDAHTALKLQRRGWRTAYLDVPQAAGLATESLSAHVGQRIRWARGMAQIFRIDNPLLGRGLTLPQRLCYLASMLHFFSGIPRLVFLVAPLWYLLFGFHVFNAAPLAALAWGLPHLVHATATNSRIQGKFRHSFWSEVYETALAFYIAIPTTMALIDPKAGRFNVTAKGGRIETAYFDWRIARPFLVLGALNVAGAAVGAWRLWTGEGEVDAVLVNLLWIAHNLVIVAATVAVAWEQRQVRASPRVPVRVPAMLRLESGHTVACQTSDLSQGGARVAARPTRRVDPGSRAWLTLFTIGGEVPLPCRVVAMDEHGIRTRFEALSADEEAALVQALFSRADAWIRWRDGRDRDVPVRALRAVSGHALSGVWRVARALRPAPRPRAEVPVLKPIPGTRPGVPVPAAARGAR